MRREDDVRSATRYRDRKWRVDFLARTVLRRGSIGRARARRSAGTVVRIIRKAPSECGFVENVGVLCWEDGDGRAHAAEAGLLSATFGSDWRMRLKQGRWRRGLAGGSLGVDDTDVGRYLLGRCFVRFRREPSVVDASADFLAWCVGKVLCGLPSRVEVVPM